MKRVGVWMVMALSAATVQANVDVDAHRQSVESWREQRVERLLRPEGWLSLVGLHWLDEGRFRIGSAADNDVVLNTGPARLGVIERSGEQIRFQPEAAAGVVIEPAVAAGEAVVLAPDSSGAPTIVRFNQAEASFILIEREGRFGLRVRDAQAPTRTGFVGIDYFPIDPAWRFEAHFIKHPPGRTIEIANVINILVPMPNPGALEFEVGGKTQRLEVVDEGDGSLFVIFSDRTNGKLTYGAGRFVYAEPIDDTHALLDFNRAYNPPCAVNAYSTCPLPPPENRLDLSVEAGEKTYRGPH